MADWSGLLRARADAYARVALGNIEQEFPHYEPLVQTEPTMAVARPRELHPAFYGSYDWHSCVEMHWLLVRLLRAASEHVPEGEIRSALDAHLTADAIAVEASYFADPLQRTTERPYGWGWALALAAELETWNDPDAARWAANLRPLVDLFVDRYLTWLPTATYPLRYGAQGNSAFGLSLALPLARAWADRGDARLVAAIDDAARLWYSGDADYPAEWEPSGFDFLSPALAEAELMASLLAPHEFADWLSRFLPDLAASKPSSLFTPAVVSDPTDPLVAHLYGLNLSRAWCWRRLAETMPDGDARVPVMLAAADRLAEAGLDHVTGSDYVVEHWLVAYAVLLLGERR